MQTFTKEEVLNELRAMVAKSNTAQVAAQLGVVRNLISMVLNEKRDISEELALRIGFVKLPDSYMRAPQKKKA